MRKIPAIIVLSAASLALVSCGENDQVAVESTEFFAVAKKAAEATEASNSFGFEVSDASASLNVKASAAAAAYAYDYGPWANGAEAEAEAVSYGYSASLSDVNFNVATTGFGEDDEVRKASYVLAADYSVSESVDDAVTNEKTVSIDMGTYIEDTKVYFHTDNSAFLSMATPFVTVTVSAETGALYYEIDNIERIPAVTYDTAVISEANNRKLTFYSWEDPLLYFYFRYVMSPSASRDFMGADTYFNEIIAGDLASFYLPTMFERVSGEYLARKNRMGLVDPPISAIGTYFHNDRLKKKNQQFDVVTLDKNGYISYECKYTDAPVGPEVFKEESEQTSGSELPFYRLGFFAKNGFSKGFPKDDCICASLADFYDDKLGD
jgi:hypothetical protein